MTLWSSHFDEELNQAAWKLNASIHFDSRMALQDIQGSIAWANAIAQAGVLNPDECQCIIEGLQKVGEEFQSDKFEYHASDEDIHTAVERRLGEIIGPLAGKLHTGRSRNDQVATDFRLWMMTNIPVLIEAIKNFQSTLINRAEADLGIYLPGYTHLQRAQPILLSHWWLSFFWPLERDRQRLINSLKSISTMPLGSAALAGTTFPVNREKLAEELGFSIPSQNSLDAVSDRDFVAEFLFNTSLLAVHLSKLAEGIILFNSSEFGFIKLSDSFSTGSSLMPQKRNPDIFELTRGKSGLTIGNLTGFLSLLKSLPSTYDKDLQDDKPLVFQNYDLFLLLLPVISGAIQTISVNKQKMQNSIDSSMLATDLADYLVKKGVPFRESYGIVGRLVKQCTDKGIDLKDLSLAEWQNASEHFDEDVKNTLDPETAISFRNVTGGTSASAVEEQIRKAKSIIQNH